MSDRSAPRSRGFDIENDGRERVEFTGRLVNGRTGNGLAGMQVRARQIGEQGARELGEARTDEDGRFSLPLSNLDAAPRPWLRLTIADPRGRTVAEEDVPVGVDGMVEVAIRDDGHEPDIGVAAKAARVRVPPALASWLGERRLETIDDVRRVGGIAGMASLPVKPDSAIVTMIDGLAALTTLPGNLETKAQMVRRGYSSIIDIARTPERLFTEALGDGVPAQAARDIHRAADVQAGVLLNVLTHVRLGGGTATMRSRIDAAIPQSCGCSDCRNVLSPLAYLANLLDYAVRHLRESGAPFTLSRLGERFHQPFATLPADCESLDTAIHGVRIAIEVLRSYFNYNAAPSWYARRLYDTLLELLGTSTGELRDARHAADDVRTRLGARLGVSVLPGKLPARPTDALDALFEPIAAGTLDEGTVESLFGYRDTRRSPIDPDPLTGSQLHGWRLGALRDAWTAEDWPAGAPATARPLIDPDQVDASDFADTAGPAYRLYSQRLTWIGNRLAAKRSEREMFGLDPMLQDLPVSGLGQAVTIGDLLQLKAQKAAGTSIDARLTSLGLTHVEFDRLAAIVQVGEANVLGDEWEEVYSILVAVEKRWTLPTWRAEERTPPASLGTVPSGYFPLTLRSGVFRLRPAPLSGGDGVEWRPKPWRSDAEARVNWVAMLRARIEHEEAVPASMRAVIARAEELCLPGLRDVLVALAPAPTRLTRADWLSRHLQIDVAIGSCGVTTRVAQAITTVQGVLFGVRSGLLEDGTIELDAPHFDEEWGWIGSYPSWRAAMSLFIYPETALQPSLRRRRSHGFSQLVIDLQAVDGAVDADAARAAALRYVAYFDDVCSLAPAGVRVSRRRVDPAAPAFFAADVLAIAPAESGRLYLSTLSGRLKEQLYGPPFLVSVDDQSQWQPIDPLPAGTDVAGVVPYHVASGAPRLAVYGRRTVDGVEQLLQTIFDGSDWTRPARVLDELPGLVRVAELRGLVPADPLADDVVSPWPIRADDWVVAADIDGDGRLELVVFAAAAQAGRRAAGILRERDATFVTSARTTLPAGFTPFVPGGPVVLRVTTGAWPWRPERVLLGDPSGPSLALLGTTPSGPLTLLALPAGPFGGFTLNFGDVVFAGGDLDDDGDSELLIVDYTAVTASDEQGNVQSAIATRLTVLNVTDTTLTLRDQESLPGVLLSMTSPGIPDRWEGFLPMRLESGRQGFLIRTVHQYFTGAGNPAAKDEWIGILKFNSLTNVFSPIELYPQGVSVFGGGSHPWAHGERLLPVELGSVGGAGSGGEILVSDPATTETRVLARRAPQAGGGYSSVWSVPAEIGRPAGSTARPWTRHGGDRFVPADLDGDGRQEIVVLGDDGRAGVLSWSSDGGLELVWAADTHVGPPGGGAGVGWRLAATDRILAADVDGDGCGEIVALSADGRLGLLRGLGPPKSGLLSATDKLRPQSVSLRTIEEKRSRAQLAAREAQISDAYTANAATPHNLAYLDEAFYFVPVELGLRLARDGAYTAALDWLASVYDYERPPATRKVAPKLELEEQLAGGLVRAADWLRDPLNPHAIAALRPNAYTRYTICTIVRVLLAYADVEFTRGSRESVARALGLYLKALELLDADELRQQLPGCADLIDRVKIDVGDPQLIPWWRDVQGLLAEIASVTALTSAVETIEALQSSDGDPGVIVASARAVALEAQAGNTATFAATADADAAVLRAAVSAGLADDDLSASFRSDYRGDQNDFVIDDPLPRFFVQPSFTFCVAPNPDLRGLRTHAESCLHKIRTCRNIAGSATSLEPYGQPGPSERLSASDRLPSPARSFVQPLPYRYSVLVERAKQLAQLAGQIQASLLGTLERRDAAAYDVLRSRQDLSLAEAGLRLNDLQVAQAADGLALARVGRERADLRLDRARALVAGAYTGGTISVIVAYAKLVFALAAAGYSFGGGGGGSGGGGGGQTGSAGGLGEAGSALGGLFSAIGSYYSNIKEQEFQMELATVDAGAAEVQLRVAAANLQVATQDRAISALRLDHAEAVAEFIARKFTGLPLYEWMSGVLQGVYRFFLQQAAVTARLAEAQLAFERQEIPPPFINGDYWARPSVLASPGGNKGLTGSDRLLRDIYDLDQYAFRTDQRKLALSKTFSLARLDPLAFRRFAETGVMHFATPTRLFDRDFPGHFLRLIKRVRVSIIVAPPTDGIHATLSTTGVSRVVQGPDFETVMLARGPESIALTSANSATGSFEPDSQPDLLVPFENMGVDTAWQLSMPKPANQFDFDTIADVLLTLEYTALDSPLHREGVLGSLDRNVTFQRILSFRNELVGAWNDLRDAGVPTPRARFRTSRADFAPNLDNIRIHDVSVYFSPASGSAPAAWRTALQTGLAFVPDQGTPFQATAAAAPVDGLITTLPGPGTTALWASLLSPPAPAPFGQWELTLPAAATTVLQAGEVSDLVFVIGYSGMLPRWAPA
jgi:hypothetical protein